jgi:hypothetical protein
VTIVISEEYRCLVTEHKNQLEKSLNKRLELEVYYSESESIEKIDITENEIDKPQEYVPHDIINHLDGKPESDFMINDDSNERTQKL